MNGVPKQAIEEFDRWSKEIKKGAASLAILAVLEHGSSYGYEIVKSLEQSGARFLAFEQGTVYPLLRRLERKRGLLKSTWNYDDPTKPRKYYSITPAGVEALKMMREKWYEMFEEMDRILGGRKE